MSKLSARGFTYSVSHNMAKDYSFRDAAVLGYINSAVRSNGGRSAKIYLDAIANCVGISVSTVKKSLEQLEGNFMISKRKVYNSSSVLTVLENDYYNSMDAIGSYTVVNSLFMYKYGIKKGMIVSRIYYYINNDKFMFLETEEYYNLFKRRFKEMLDELEQDEILKYTKQDDVVAIFCDKEVLEKAKVEARMSLNKKYEEHVDKKELIKEKLRKELMLRI